jgi:deoxyribodipyrimidine photo-lyase
MLLRAAGVALGRTYPQPIIGHAQGRARALAAYAEAKAL